MSAAQYISIPSAMKRLRSPDFNEFNAASRRVAWDSVMASGNRTQIREANEARDRYAFSSTPTPDEAIPAPSRY